VWHCHILDHEDHDMMRPMVDRQAAGSKRMSTQTTHRRRFVFTRGAISRGSPGPDSPPAVGRVRRRQARSSCVELSERPGRAGHRCDRQVDPRADHMRGAGSASSGPPSSSDRIYAPTTQGTMRRCRAMTPQMMRREPAEVASPDAAPLFRVDRRPLREGGDPHLRLQLQP
jgi:hypothetical protein